jgi:hypothetical protein
MKTKLIAAALFGATNFSAPLAAYATPCPGPGYTWVAGYSYPSGSRRHRLDCTALCRRPTLPRFLASITGVRICVGRAGFVTPFEGAAPQSLIPPKKSTPV